MLRATEAIVALRVTSGELKLDPVVAADHADPALRKHAPATFPCFCDVEGRQLLITLSSSCVYSFEVAQQRCVDNVDHAVTDLVHNCPSLPSPLSLHVVA